MAGSDERQVAPHEAPPGMLPGEDPVIEHYKQFLDWTLLRENLRRSPEERILHRMRVAAMAEALRAAMASARKKP